MAGGAPDTVSGAAEDTTMALISGVYANHNPDARAMALRWTSLVPPA